MNKEPIYRIKVEVIGEEAESCKLDKRLREGGIECNGFAILADNKDRTTVALHAVSNIDIATMIAHDNRVMAASLVAQAMREGKKYLNEGWNPIFDIMRDMYK